MKVGAQVKGLQSTLPGSLFHGIEWYFGTHKVFLFEKFIFNKCAANPQVSKFGNLTLGREYKTANVLKSSQRAFGWHFDGLVPPPDANTVQFVSVNIITRAHQKVVFIWHSASIAILHRGISSTKKISLLKSPPPSFLLKSSVLSV